MRHTIWMGVLVAAIVVAAGCARLRKDTPQERHSVDTEFVVE